MIERIFYGRNGIDAYSMFIFAVALLFMSVKWTWIFGIALIAYALFRCFSKNITKRRSELWKFQSVLYAAIQYLRKHTVGLRKFFSLQSLKLKNRKTTVYFKCPRCKKILSLPRHKEKLAVTCTVCGNKFIKKT